MPTNELYVIHVRYSRNFNMHLCPQSDSHIRAVSPTFESDKVRVSVHTLLQRVSPRLLETLDNCVRNLPYGALFKIKKSQNRFDAVVG